MKRKLLNYIVMLAGVISIYSCGNDEGQNGRKVVFDDKNKPDQTVNDVKISFVDSNYTKATMKAKLGRVFSKLSETWLNGDVVVEFYSKASNSRIGVLTSDSMKVDDATRDMYAFGKVKMVSDSSRVTLETTLLKWSNKEKKIKSTEFVRIISPNETLQGYGFESDEKLTHYKIYKVTGEQR
jgi:LPS export ABC transporter protein LptC